MQTVRDIEQPWPTSLHPLIYLMFGGANFPPSKNYTFFSNVHHTYSCIDLFLVDTFFLQKVTKSDIRYITWSDHASISISVGEIRTKRKPNR